MDKLSCAFLLIAPACSVQAEDGEQGGRHNVGQILLYGEQGTSLPSSTTHHFEGAVLAPKQGGQGSSAF